MKPGDLVCLCYMFGEEQPVKCFNSYVDEGPRTLNSHFKAPPRTLALVIHDNPDYFEVFLVTMGRPAWVNRQNLVLVTPPT